MNTIRCYEAVEIFTIIQNFHRAMKNVRDYEAVELFLRDLDAHTDRGDLTEAEAKEIESAFWSTVGDKLQAEAECD